MTGKGIVFFDNNFPVLTLNILENFRKVDL